MNSCYQDIECALFGLSLADVLLVTGFDGHVIDKRLKQQTHFPCSFNTSSLLSFLLVAFMSKPGCGC